MAKEQGHATGIEESVQQGFNASILLTFPLSWQQDVEHIGEGN